MPSDFVQLWWKNTRMSFISLIGSFFVILIASFLQSIETPAFNQQHMHFVQTKEKVISSKKKVINLTLSRKIIYPIVEDGGDMHWLCLGSAILSVSHLHKSNNMPMR